MQYFANSALCRSMVLLFLTMPSVFAQKDYGVHDPSGLVREGDRYYTFYTSKGIESAYSTDLCTWHYAGKVFPSAIPSWITAHVTGFDGNFWAPQAFYMNGTWHVYYSCSTFGSRVSAIGLATSSSLKNPDWSDAGMVVSTDNSSDHNAIDPAVLKYDGRVWLVFGSFWKGIVMTELDSLTGKPVKNSTLSYLADGDPEAAFLTHHDEYFYLFFNRGKCCSGVNSTYYICVGRAGTATGPYLDKTGKRTGTGGGSVLLETQGRFIGPGHFGYLADGGREYMSYHYYDRNQNGASKLRITAISWKDGWPAVDTGFDVCDPAVPVKPGREKAVRRDPANCTMVNGYTGGKTVRVYSLSGKLLLTVEPSLHGREIVPMTVNSAAVIVDNAGRCAKMVNVW